MMTVTQVAGYLQVSRQKVYELIKRKQDPLPVIRNIGEQSPRVSRAILEGWLAGVFENSHMEDKEGEENV